MTQVLFVAIDDEFPLAISTVAQLEEWIADQPWQLYSLVDQFHSCERVVAVHLGRPVAAWHLRGMNGNGHLSLGEPLGVAPEYDAVRTLIARRCRILEIA